MEQVQKKSGNTQTGSPSTGFTLNRVFRSILVFLALVLLGGCTPLGVPVAELPVPTAEPDGINSARLSCFLALKDEEGPAIRLEVSGVEVLSNGLWVPISTGPLKIDSEKLGASQIFLGGQAVPPGSYKSLRMTVTGGMMWKAEGGYVDIAQEPFDVEVGLTPGLNLEPEDSRSLFVTWDVEKSLDLDNKLRPFFTVTPSLKQLPVDLIYVACPDIDTIFVVRADKNWVVDSFGLKGGPTYLVIDPDPLRRRLYVLASRERTIKVVDLSSYRVIDYLPIPLNDEPTFMAVSSDGQGAFLLDERSGYLSRMDLNTGRSDARVLLGFRPNYAVFLEEQNLLAVSLSLSQRVVLLDPMTLAEVRTIPSGSSPRGLLVAENQLYIAESGDDTVSVFDLDGRDGQRRLMVGGGPRRLSEVDNRIYVSNYESGSLSVLMSGQLGVVQEIPGLGRPQEMAFDRAYRRLYVSDGEGLSVIDVNANLLLGRIVLGARSLGLDVIQ